MKNSLLLLSISVISMLARGQSPLPEQYHKLIQQADSLYGLKQYHASASAYSDAFKSNGWKGFVPHRYNAARCWALVNIPDSAFHNLFRIAAKGNYADHRQITTDPELYSLHEDPRWQQVLLLVQRNKDEKEKYYNKALINSITEMEYEDQKWRGYLRQFNNGERKNDTITQAYIHKQIRVTDSVHHFKLWNIFIMHGFPNYDLVGETASFNFWLLMQHQDQHPKFQQAVLEKMKIEVDQGKANPANYAYLVDRVNVNTGQKQVYGTQMILNAEGTSYVPQPVIEPEKLNERRASVGLEPIEEYIKTMNTYYHGSLKK